jgi:hypothetical protein
MGGARSLCEVCHHRREIRSAKGSRFLLCQLSVSDKRFPKYPAQPVLACEGFDEMEKTPESREAR